MNLADTREHADIPACLQGKCILHDVQYIVSSDYWASEGHHLEHDCKMTTGYCLRPVTDAYIWLMWLSLRDRHDSQGRDTQLFFRLQ